LTDGERGSDSRRVMVGYSQRSVVPLLAAGAFPFSVAKPTNQLGGSHPTDQQLDGYGCGRYYGLGSASRGCWGRHVENFALTADQEIMPAQIGIKYLWGISGHTLVQGISDRHLETLGDAKIAAAKLRRDEGWKKRDKRARPRRSTSRKRDRSGYVHDRLGHKAGISGNTVGRAGVRRVRTGRPYARRP